MMLSRFVPNFSASPNGVWVSFMAAGVTAGTINIIGGSAGVSSPGGAIGSVVFSGELLWLVLMKSDGLLLVCMTSCGLSGLSESM